MARPVVRLGRGAGGRAAVEGQGLEATAGVSGLLALS